jgi:glutamate dehydrogenase
MDVGTTGTRTDGGGTSGGSGSGPGGPSGRRDDRAARLETALRAFAEQYWARVPVEDRLAHTAAQREAAARAHLLLASKRPVGSDLVRVSAPGEGAGTARALVEVVADDQAFLVDSVRLAISRLGLGVDLVVHPVVRALRDPAGWLQGVLRPHDPGPEAIPESYIRVELEVETDPAALAGLEREVTRVLRDVHLVNRDWAAMRDTTRRLAEGLASEPLPTDPDDVEEIRALLDWMVDHHFVFLGYREYRLGRVDGEEVLEALPQTGLGLLAPRLPQLAAEQRSPLTQPLRSLPPGAQRLVAAPDLLLVTKANARSTVLRGTRLDYLGVKRFDDTGRVVGERRILGLFTSPAYRLSPRHVPLLRRKVAAIERLGGFAPDSHDANRLADVLDTLPRTELFQASTPELAETAFGVLGLQERRRVRLLVRTDVFGRFVSCLVYLPRDRYATGVRVRVQELLRKAYAGTAVDYDTSLTESALARLHVIVHLPEGTDTDVVRAVDVRRLESEIVGATRSWDDELAAALVAASGETRGGDLARRYRGAFGPAYRDDVAAADAVVDVERLERLDPAGDLHVVLRRPVGDVLRLRLYRTGGGLALSDVLPLLHDAGVTVLEARPHEVHRRERTGAAGTPDGSAGEAAPPQGGVWVHDLHLRHPGCGVLPREVATAFEEVLTRAWRGQTDSDGFTRLVLAAGLSAREVDLVRAYGRYLRQTASTYSQDYQEDALAAHPHVVRLLVDLFAARTDPSWRRSSDGAAGAAAEAERLEAEVRAALDGVESLDEDRILRSFLGLVLATLRTSWWQRDAGGRPPEAVVLKLDSARVPDLPEPRPYVEVWVHSPRVEGVHLRGGPVARGGLRWSDRREDFRTEVLGLMKAQMTKNAVIVPVGAKGGFVVKRPPAERAALVDEAVACYRTFVSGLLDLTDNLVEGRVVPPADVVRHDGDDPYLVVAADKGTATLSDTANALAEEHGFWLGDAFASGGSHGYDHKAMGITARGAWMSARRHGLELGIDVENDDFTVVGIGDMSGDVFGNGMLLSRHLRLVAAFDHRHVFLDPDPDAASSYDERARLFALPRSSWAEYDPALISEGGGVWPRTAKSIPLSSQVRTALGLPDTAPDALAPAELMRAVLAAPVDMLWNGGVGTYVKASAESHADAGDKANDPIRVDGRDLRARMVVEGGNLGLTQRGRIEYARSGGLVNTDAIDNSAGVDCSDHEVNIKVLLRAALDDGALAPEDRDPLLAAMTDEVARLVLADNDGQTRALSNARAQAAGMVDVHRRYLRVLEGAGVVSRALEALPTDDELVERSATGQGLVGPEFAVLLAYTKTRLYAELLDSDVPEDPWLGRELVRYFPTLLRERFVPQMGNHRLRREIIATSVANELVNRQGTTFAFRLGEETGARAADITRAFTVAREVFGMSSLWDEVEALDGGVASDVQVALFLRARALVERATRWLLRARPTPLDIAATVAELAPVAGIAGALPSMLGTLAAEQAERAEAADVAAGVPVHVARRVAVLPMLVGALDVVDVARAEDAEPLEAARVYYALGDRLRLDWLRRQVVELPRRDRWQTLARAALRDDYYAVRRQLTGEVLAAGGVEEWDRAARPRIDRFLRLLADIESRGATDLAALSVALRGARTLTEGPKG